MMRVIMAMWWTLAVLWLVTHPLEVQSKPGKAAQTPPGWPEQVTGYGDSVALAKEDAVRQAGEELVKFLRVKGKLPRGWEVSENYIKKNVLDGAGQKGDDAELAPNLVKKTWIVKLKPPDFAKIAQIEERMQREVRVEERLSLGGYFIAAALVCLGGTSALLSAREWLKKRKLASVTR